MPSFPTEVVEQIFAFFSTTLSTDNLVAFPWLLGHICSTWRSLYLSMTTEFWHSISVSLNTRCTHTTKLVVRFFLERNPEAPFSFDFYPPSHLAQFSQCRIDDMSSVLEMLIDGSMRWERVTFYCERAVDLLPLIRAKNRLLLLQELHLPFFYDGDEVPVVLDQLHDVFATAPSLDTITMHDLDEWTFDWSNLKNIYIFGLTSSAFITALPHMTKLERLSVNSVPDPVPSTVILLPSLKFIFCYSGWLPFLNTPALVELVTCYDPGAESASIDITLSFLRRSSCNILRLGIGYTQAATAIEIIRHIPHLTVSPNPAQEILARHMVSLEIVGVSDVFDDNMGPLYDLILSRIIVADDDSGYKKLQELSLYGLKTSNAICGDLIRCKSRYRLMMAACWGKSILSVGVALQTRT